MILSFSTWNLINGRSAFIKNIKKSQFFTIKCAAGFPEAHLRLKCVCVCVYFCLCIDAHIVRWSPDGDKYAVVIHDRLDLYDLQTASLTSTLKNPQRISAINFLNVRVFFPHPWMPHDTCFSLFFCILFARFVPELHPGCCR